MTETADAGGATLLDAVEATFDLRRDPSGDLVGANVDLPGFGRVFGGQLLAQSLAAAVADAGPDEKVPRSLHLVFVAEGHLDEEVRFEVTAPHTGRTFATRSVTIFQGERLLATGLVSLHALEEGVEHQEPAPDVPRPDELKAIPPTGAMPLEMRVAGDVALDSDEVGPPELMVWMRAARPVRPESPLAQQQLLAYCSDATMMAAALRPHPGLGFGSKLLLASAVTSQTISFHRPFVASDWLLFAQTSPVTYGGRAYVQGDWFDAGGALVASCAQEALIRTGIASG